MKISNALSWSSIYSHGLSRPLHSQSSTCLGNTRQNDIDIHYPNTFALKKVECYNSTTKYQCDAHTYFLLPPFLFGCWVLGVIKNVLSRPPPSSTPTPPTTPTTSATRVPDPLEDFATFVSFCSKVYADQGESDLYEAEWFTLIGPDLCAIRVTFGHRKNLC